MTADAAGSPSSADLQHRGVEPRTLGERGLVLRLPRAAVPADWAHGASALAGVREAVAGGSSVMLRFDRERDRNAALDALAAVKPVAAARDEARVVKIDVVYDGDDLDETAELLGLSPEALVAAHTAAEWTARFVGFAPGFAYLEAPSRAPGQAPGQTPGNALAVPRRDSPRTRVPRGSVALAGGYSAVYPRETPGGWRLIGRTDVRLWDEARGADAALVTAGTRVRFTPVRGSARAAGSAEAKGVEQGSDAASISPPELPRALTVAHTGLPIAVIDEGRPGFAGLGVSTSGAMDRGAYRRANRLVGNPRGAAALELSGAGAELAFTDDTVVAVTGAVGELWADGVGEVLPNAPFLVRAGAILAIEPADRGVRIVVAVRGGVLARETLGSRSSDTLGGLGPTPLLTGDRIGIASEPHTLVGNPEAGPALPGLGETIEVPIVPGPDDDQFAPAQWRALCENPWTVTPRSDRIGMRLAGEPLVRMPGLDIESQGLVRGAVQVPPDGQPIVFQADHPATGGYPVIGVVTESALDVLAQAPAGVIVSFIAQRRTARPPA